MIVDTLLILAMTAYCCCAVALFVYGANCYVMMALFLRRQKKQRREDRELIEHAAQTLDDDCLPVVTTQLPIYNEKYVIERLLNAVCAFDYPKDKHEIQVLDDSTDETYDIIARLVLKLSSQGHDIHHVHRKKRNGYKAGALAEGMKISRGELFAIFDADFVPQSDFLRKTVPCLIADPQCGFVQARWGHLNRDYSLITMAQSIGIDGHFAIEQSARAWNGLFLNFNGTTGVWRKKAIEEAGGWKADTITEDLDLSYRAQLTGWKARYLLDVVAPAEIPVDINAFKSQQHRWAKGSIQTALKILPVVFSRPDIGWFKKFQALLHLTHYLVHPIIFLMTLLVLPLLLWGGETFQPLIIIPLLTLMLVSMLAPSSLYVLSQRITNKNWVSNLKFIPGLMILGMGLAVNNTMGVMGALFRRKRNEFVRTPKLGAFAERRTTRCSTVPQRSSRAYLIPLNRLFLIEAFMGLWATAAFVSYLSFYKFLVGPIFFLHAMGYLYVGLVSVVHDRRAKHLQI